MINCLIADDEQHAIDLLSNHISKTPWIDLKYTTTRPVEALQYISHHKIDLILLDIQMPALNGMDFLALLKGKPKVILTTAYTEYAMRGYEHDVVDYLLKPIVFERFLQAVNKAADQLRLPDKQGGNVDNNTTNTDFIFVRTEGKSKLVRVLLPDIEYIETLGNYQSIYTTQGRVITHLTMKEIEQQLPSAQFIRIHNSYMVPIQKVVEVEGNQLQVGKQKLPIGDVYKKHFLSVIERHVMRSKR
jgi:two-component system, LytTR family, response regulator